MWGLYNGDQRPGSGGGHFAGTLRKQPKPAKGVGYHVDILWSSISVPYAESPANAVESILVNSDGIKLLPVFSQSANPTLLNRE